MSDEAAVDHGFDIDVELPEIWESHSLDAEANEEAIQQMAELLADKVDDPELVARETFVEFLQRVGGGGEALMYASVNEELDDESVLAATMTVTRNDLTGDLDAWRDVYEDSIDLTVADHDAIRIVEETMVRADEFFEEPLTVSTWRYVVTLGTGVMIFAFTTPNHELREVFEDHFDAIMDHVRIQPSEPETPDATEAED